MIHVVDDRQKRMHLSIAGKVLYNNVKLYTEEEVLNFKKQLELKTFTLKDDCQILCVHQSSLFSNEEERDYLKKVTLVPLIFFSGNYNIISTIKSNILYTANVNAFYSCITTSDVKFSASEDINKLLFGDKYRNNSLWKLIEKIRVTELVSSGSVSTGLNTYRKLVREHKQFLPVLHEKWLKEHSRNVNEMIEEIKIKIYE